MRESYLSNALLWTIIVGNSILRTETVSKGLPEQALTVSNCPNGTLEGIFTPVCLTGKIAVDSLSFVCIKTVNCSDQSQMTSVPNGILELAVSKISGGPQRAFPVPAVQSSCDARHTFMVMNYYCVQGQALEICSANTSNSRNISYIWSKGYPDGPFKETACSCSVRVNDQRSSVGTTPQLGSSNISVITIHSKLVAGQQLVMTSPYGSVLKNITEDVHDYTIRHEQFPYTYININWKSMTNNTNGTFWVGFQSSNPFDTVTLSCQKPSTTTLPTQLKSTTTPVSHILASSGSSVIDQTTFSSDVSSVSPFPSSNSVINSTSLSSSVDSSILSTTTPARHEGLQSTPEENSMSSNPFDTVTLSCQEPSTTILPTQSKSTTTPVSHILASSGSSDQTTFSSDVSSVSQLPSSDSIINSTSLSSSVDSSILSTTTPARHEGLQGTPEEDSFNVIPIIAGVLGALLLLVAIIIIVCFVVKRKKNAVVPRDTKEEASTKNLAYKENMANKEKNTSSGVPKLPPLPISGNIIAYPEDGIISDEIPKRQKRKRKKRKRWTEKVSGQSKGGTEKSFETGEHRELDYEKHYERDYVRSENVGSYAEEKKIKKKKKKKRNKDGDLASLTREDEEYREFEV